MEPAATASPDANSARSPDRTNCSKGNVVVSSPMTVIHAPAEPATPDAARIDAAQIRIHISQDGSSERVGHLKAAV